MMEKAPHTLFRSLRFLRNAGEGVFLTAGVCALVTGILVDLFVIRLLCLGIMIVAGVLLFASMRARQLHINTASGSTAGAAAPSEWMPQNERRSESRVTFDDFQLHARTQEPAPGGDDGFAPAIDDAPRVIRTGGAPGPAAGAPAAPAREYGLADFFDVDAALFKGDAEPRTELDFLLGKVLTVIKDVLFAHTVAFFWANHDKGQMVLEAKATESRRFSSARRFPIGHDLVSGVAQSGKPAFITDVNPDSEPELFRYYDAPDAVKSFIGVPVFFSAAAGDPMLERPVGVIAVDSRAADDFGPETLELLGRFTKLVSALIKSSNDKYDLLLDSELLTSIRRLQERIRGEFTLKTIVNALADETSKLINWDVLAVVLYDEGKHAWVAQKVTNRTAEAALTPGTVIDYPGSLTGRAIRTNAHAAGDDLAATDAPRYASGERQPRAGSFLAVPLSSLNKCYGAVTIESRERFNFSRRDTDMLYRLADNAAAALEIYYMQELIHDYVIVDEQTGLVARKFFVQRLDEELARADDGGTELSMIVLTVDRAGEIAERFGEEGKERVMLTLAKAVRNGVRPYDIVARYDAARIAVLLVNTAANDAYVWAEKLRKSIAGLVISLDERTFSITVSAGVCGALDGMRRDELLADALTVLEKAAEAGGNTVRVY